MKEFTFITLLVSLSLTCHAQQTIVKKIAALETAEATAVLHHDTAALSKIWDVHFIVNAPINKVTPNRQKVLELVKNEFISYSSFTRNRESLLVAGDVVITMGSEVVVPSGNRPHRSQMIKRRYTHVWKKKNGEWKLIARHANVICNDQLKQTKATHKIIPAHPD